MIIIIVEIPIPKIFNNYFLFLYNQLSFSAFNDYSNSTLEIP